MTVGGCGGGTVDFGSVGAGEGAGVGVGAGGGGVCVGVGGLTTFTVPAAGVVGCGGGLCNRCTMTFWCVGGGGGGGGGVGAATCCGWRIMIVLAPVPCCCAVCATNTVCV